ncbi:hypothetical protein OF820_12180 [Oceanotoga sp. DSM 15011]|jgi:hypothetical protein|uniref:Uncharacterized protein n=1 Tax=Oceanotoga teriensis TaxID=515440 RepID=A0AA45HI66_9BACT|nr:MULTISPECIES: hypothetical protein [Oceanotoga]MDN5341786.1 hypothetical protein [Oceanotoga sp.]MDO7975699.1 hypothetical protein [Oceanotoga teriensis]PWJ90553.1 hypothetical protein C7380_11221 [Oceanotoga teriensis]UYO99797.1 hypothetical protein OF820_12180 [Oceanotoga sp. DSM 15011]
MSDKVLLSLSGIKNENFEIEKNEFETFEKLVDFYGEDTKGILTYIKINDQEIPLNYFDEVKNAFFEGGESIELMFETKKSVLNSLIEEGFEYINKVRENLDNLSKEVLMNSQEGHKMLGSLSEGFEALLTIINQTNEYIGEVTYNEQQIEKIKSILSTIVQAQASKNYIELSDNVDFDLPEIINIFDDVLKESKRILNHKVN